MRDWIFTFYNINGSEFSSNRIYYWTLPNTLEIVAGYEYGLVSGPKKRIT